MAPTVSIVMTTYEGDSPSSLQSCFASLLKQKRQPNEVVIIRSYHLPSELTQVIAQFNAQASFIVRDICVDEQGRGHARKIGVDKATSELIAIIDADDIACPDRLSRQLKYFETNPSVDVVGGYVGEFTTSPNKIESIRKVPTGPDEIKKVAYYRCPINHPAVMFRRDAARDVGNYREIEYGEDYELWCRMLANNKKFANIPKILVKVRAAELVTRRQGYEIVRREIQLQRAIVQSGFYGWGVACANLAIRVPIRMLPKQFLKQIYGRLLRS